MPSPYGTCPVLCCPLHHWLCPFPGHLCGEGSQFGRAGSFPEGESHILEGSERGRFDNSGRRCQEVIPALHTPGTTGKAVSQGWKGGDANLIIIVLTLDYIFLHV